MSERKRGRPRLYETNAEKQAAWKAAHPEKRHVPQYELAMLARGLVDQIGIAAMSGNEDALRLRGSTKPETMRNLIAHWKRVNECSHETE